VPNKAEVSRGLWGIRGKKRRVKKTKPPLFYPTLKRILEEFERDGK
jgi:hypothetical protein